MDSPVYTILWHFGRREQGTSRNPVSAMCWRQVELNSIEAA